MKSFCLVRENTNGRIFLEEEHQVPEKGVSILTHIKAASWPEAREQVKATNMYHVEGYGWYDHD